MYDLFYELNDRPFDVKPDLKYFHPTHSHKRAIEHMRAGLEQPDGVIVLTGEKGTGKTSLIMHMLEQLDKDDNNIAFFPGPPQKTSDFLPAILTALQIPVTGHQPRELFNALHKFMLEQLNQNKKVQLVVDDAESLSKNNLEFIRLLSTLRVNERGLMQIILVGTNDLNTIITASEDQTLSQQISMAYCLQALQATETREYIEHRLKAAGWKRDPIIDEDAFDDIHQLSAGVPYAINQYCDRLLMLGMLRESHHINSNSVANLTSDTLEQTDVEQLGQKKHTKSATAAFDDLFSSHQESEEVAPSKPAMQGFDVENIHFDAPTKFNKKPIITIAAACLLVSVSVFLFDKMSKDSHSKTANVTHSAPKDHSTKTNNHSSSTNDHSTTVNANTAQSENSLKTVKYVLQTIPADSDVDSKLDIQQLLKKSNKSDFQAISDQSDKELINEVVSNANMSF
ncbi:MAG: AAA family ATPase [Gammaproteobacteria bacterium]|nr:AAA family ATPase [Gammaproteobacteria bacterium]